MSNVDLKVAIEKKWRTQNFDCLSLEFVRRLQGSFWGAPTYADINEFSNFLSQCKIQRSASKTMCGFSVLFILKGIIFLKSCYVYTFESQRVHIFCWIKIWSLIKARRNQKWEILHTVLERWTMCFSSYKNCELKVNYDGL